jgi:hypothetical protein
MSSSGSKIIKGILAVWTVAMTVGASPAVCSVLTVLQIILWSWTESQTRIMLGIRMEPGMIETMAATDAMAIVTG